MVRCVRRRPNAAVTTCTTAVPMGAAWGGRQLQLGAGCSRGQSPWSQGTKGSDPLKRQRAASAQLLPPATSTSTELPACSAQFPVPFFVRSRTPCAASPIGAVGRRCNGNAAAVEIVLG